MNNGKIDAALGAFSCISHSGRGKLVYYVYHHEGVETCIDDIFGGVEMISVDKALQIVLDLTRVLDPVDLPVLEARGRVLAQDIVSSEDVPAFDYAMLSGYAINSKYAAGASSKNPIEIYIDGELFPGQHWPKPIDSGHAVKIISGAPIPEGADSVLLDEHVVRQTNGKGLVYRQPIPGENIRYKGEDITKGTLVLAKGKRINAADIGVISALGLSEIKCYPAPKVSFLVTGSALSDSNGPLPYGMMRCSNRFALYSQLAEYGAQPVDLGIACRDQEIIQSKILEGLEHDMLISSVGPTMEDFTFVKKILERVGMDIKFWKVAIKPGKPMIFGTCGDKPIFGISGHPYSSYVVLEQFVRPALMKMMGMNCIRRTEVMATLTRDVRGEDGVTNFIRGVVTFTEDGIQVTPTLRNNSSVRAFSTVNGLIVVPPNSGYIQSGQKIKVQIIAEPETLN